MVRLRCVAHYFFIFALMTTNRAMADTDCPEKFSKLSSIVDILNGRQKNTAEAHRIGVETRMTLEASPFWEFESIPSGSILQVVQLPVPAAKGTAFTNAFQHPEMADYKRRLEAMGRRLVIDVDLPMPGTDAYYNLPDKIVGVSPDVPWHVFRHEFRHAEFDEFMTARRLNASSRGGSEVLPKRIRDILGRRDSKFVLQMERRGMPENAINETLAVDAEIESLGFRRFLPGSSINVESRRIRLYSLGHQIEDLQNVEKPDRSQRQLLKTAIAERDKHIRFITKSAERPWFESENFGAMARGAAVGVGLGWLAYEFKELIYSTNTGEIYARTKENTWVKFETEQLKIKVKETFGN